MLKTRVDKKKILEYSAILGIIFLIMGYIIVTNFILKPGRKSSDKAESIEVTPVKKVNNLDIEIIEADKFKNLQENPVIEKELEDLEVGKQNPFSSGEVKNK